MHALYHSIILYAAILVISLFVKLMARYNNRTKAIKATTGGPGRCFDAVAFILNYYETYSFGTLMEIGFPIIKNE